MQAIYILGLTAKKYGPSRNPQHNIVINEFIQKWIEVADTKLQKFNSQDLSNSLWALAHLEYKDTIFLEQLIEVAYRKLVGFSSQGLSNSLWALARLEYKDKDFIEEWIEVAYMQLKRFNSQDLANSLWALANFKHTDEGFIKKWIEVASIKLWDDGHPQDLSHSIWALARLKYQDEDFLKKWIEVASNELDKERCAFDPQHLANIILAFAHLKYKDEDFLKKWIKVATTDLWDFNAQDLSNSVWALANLQYQDKSFLEQWIEVADTKLSTFSSQDLSTSLWALVNLQYKDTGFLKQWIKVASKKLDKEGYNFDPQHLSNSVWALAHLKYKDEAFLKKWVDVAYSKLWDFYPQELSNIIWALASLKYEDTGFLKKWIKVATTDLLEFEPQRLSKSLSALAQLEYQDKSFIQEWIKVAVDQLQNFDTQDLSNSAFGLANFHLLSTDNEQIYNALLQVFVHINNGCDNNNELSSGYKRQITQAFYMLTEQDQKEFSKLATEIAQFHTELSEDITIASRLHNNVFELLSKIRPDIKFSNEVYIKEIATTVDIFVESSNLIIQVDGPVHFNSNDEYNINTKRNTKLLEKYGYKLIRINYQDFNAVEQNEEAAAAYLNSLLESVETHKSLKRSQSETSPDLENDEFTTEYGPDSKRSKLSNPYDEQQEDNNNISAFHIKVQHDLELLNHPKIQQIMKVAIAKKYVDQLLEITKDQDIATALTDAIDEKYEEIIARLSADSSSPEAISNRAYLMAAEEVLSILFPESDMEATSSTTALSTMEIKEEQNIEDIIANIEAIIDKDELNQSVWFSNYAKYALFSTNRFLANSAQDVFKLIGLLVDNLQRSMNLSELYEDNVFSNLVTAYSIQIEQIFAYLNSANRHMRIAWHPHHNDDFDGPGGSGGSGGEDGQASKEEAPDYKYIDGLLLLGNATSFTASTHEQHINM